MPDVVNGCGTCWWCLRHHDGLCRNLSVRGQQDDGGLAEYMVARAMTCVTLPSGLSTDNAVLAEPAAVAVRAVRKAPDPIGATAVVIGGGPVGQLTAQAAIAFGAARCWLVDPSPFRRGLAESHSTVRACDPAEIGALVAELGEPGVDVVYECSGAPGQIQNALTLVRPGGAVVAVGLGSDPQPLPLTALVLAERQLIGSAAHIWDIDIAQAVRMLADGRFDTRGLITHRVPLADLVTVALPLLSSPNAEVLKVAIDCR